MCRNQCSREIKKTKTAVLEMKSALRGNKSVTCERQTEREEKEKGGERGTAPSSNKENLKRRFTLKQNKESSYKISDRMKHRSKTL